MDTDVVVGRGRRRFRGHRAPGRERDAARGVLAIRGPRRDAERRGVGAAVEVKREEWFAIKG